MAILTGSMGGFNDYEQSLRNYERQMNEQRFYEMQKRAMHGLGNYQQAGIAPPPVNKEVSNTDLILLIEETQDEA